MVSYISHTLFFNFGRHNDLNDLNLVVNHFRMSMQLLNFCKHFGLILTNGPRAGHPT